MSTLCSKQFTMTVDPVPPPSNWITIDHGCGGSPGVTVLGNSIHFDAGPSCYFVKIPQGVDCPAQLIPEYHFSTTSRVTLGPFDTDKTVEIIGTAHSTTEDVTFYCSELINAHVEEGSTHLELFVTPLANDIKEGGVLIDPQQTEIHDWQDSYGSGLVDHPLDFSYVIPVGVASTFWIVCAGTGGSPQTFTADFTMTIS